MIGESGSIELSASPGSSPAIRAKKWIKRVKDRLNRKKKATSRKVAVQLNISRTSVRRILKNDLLLRPYKKMVEPLLIDERKEEKNFRTGYQDVFEKREHDEDSVRHKWNPSLPKCSYMGSQLS